MKDYEQEKQIAAKEAVKYVKNHMILGVGSGSTVKYFIHELGQAVSKGLLVTAVPTSKETAELCKAADIPLYHENKIPENIDLTVDGADEFDADLNLTKGGGGDLLWEKIIASVSKRELIIADSRKQVAVLGQTFPLPVEVIPCAADILINKIKKLQLNPVLRLKQDGTPFITDEGNYLLDCASDGMKDLYGMSEKLDHIIGVVEHGIFLGMADMVIMGNNDTVEYFTAKSECIDDATQKNTMEKIFAKMKDSREKGQTPVIELDLDLTTFVPAARAMEGLKAAGKEFGITEFEDPIFDLLPGYTREAWTAFISRNRLPQKYPHLEWLGNKDGIGGSNVYSVFHTRFWDTELLHLDTLVRGLPEFIKKAEEMGAVVIFVSGRWKEEQFEPTREVLRKGNLEHVPLLIGNPKHDGTDVISDSEIKALHQKEIREKYGTPAIFVDDRQENRNAVLNANPGIDMLDIGIAIPGFTYDQETTGVDLKLTTWNM